MDMPCVRDETALIHDPGEMRVGFLPGRGVGQGEGGGGGGWEGLGGWVDIWALPGGGLTVNLTSLTYI